MSEKDSKSPLETTDSAEEQIKTLLDAGVQVINKEIEKFAGRITEFNQNRKEIRRRIKNGARRTNGRIV